MLTFLKSPSNIEPITEMRIKLHTALCHIKEEYFCRYKKKADHLFSYIMCGVCIVFPLVNDRAWKSGNILGKCHIQFCRSPLILEQWIRKGGRLLITKNLKDDFCSQ